MLLRKRKSTTYRHPLAGNPATEPFSLNRDLLRAILDRAKPLGHHSQNHSLNLGFGFLYYGLVRSLRPGHIVVIGSGYGFSVVCLALGCKDNGFGKVSFVDPAFSLLKNGPFQTVGGLGKWKDPLKVQEHFQQFGLDNEVCHYRMTSEAFFSSYEKFELPPIEVGFIDGNHSFKHVRHDFLVLMSRAAKNSYIFLHDSNIYIREAVHHSGVKRWLNILKKAPGFFEVIDFPFSSGVALVRILSSKKWEPPKQPETSLEV